MGILFGLLALVVPFGMAGVAAAWALLRGFKPGLVVLTGAVTMGCLITALLLLGQSGQNQDSLTSLRMYFDQSWNLQAQWLKDSGLQADKIEAVKGIFQKYIFWSFPAWVAVSCLVTGLLVYYLASFILSRVTPRVSKPMVFREWAVPEFMVFGLIAGGVLKLLFKENSPMDLVGNNCLVLFAAIYTLGGLSIVSFFFHKWRLPVVFRIFGYVFLFQVVFETVCAIGVLDVWFDFRKRKTAPPEPTA